MQIHFVGRVVLNATRNPVHRLRIPRNTNVLSLRWRHNGRDGVSNHQRLYCLLNCLFRHRSKKTSKLRVTSLCAENSPGTGEFPAQKASNAENVSIWLHYQVVFHCGHDDFMRLHRCLLNGIKWGIVKLPVCYETDIRQVSGNQCNSNKDWLVYQQRTLCSRTSSAAYKHIVTMTS